MPTSQQLLLLSLTLVAGWICQPAYGDSPHTQDAQKLEDTAKTVGNRLMEANEGLRKSVYNETAAEADDCLAFYITERACIGTNDPTPPPGYDKATAKELDKKLNDAERVTYELARTLTAGGEIKEETIWARAEMSSKANIETLNHDCGNLSLIQKDKTYFCKDLVENPFNRLSYWLDKLQQDKK
jgi:hypothetical protein